MKLTAKVKLQPDTAQRQALLETLEAANDACNHISTRAWDMRIFKQFPIHRLTYREVRDMFDLSAQMVIRCIGKVADAYKIDRDTRRQFDPHGAIPFDNRILRWFVDKQEVSIWTMQGRQRMPFLAGPRQLELLKTQRGESDLCYITGEWYLFATCDVEAPEPQDTFDVLGVDLGVKNIAVDSDGNFYSEQAFTETRLRHHAFRRHLQKLGTKSAKKLLKQQSGRESRFRHHVNHVISKRLVTLAQDTQRVIALEDLSGIRDRVTVRRGQRYGLHSWSFYDLRCKIEYKAALAGVPVVYIDPRNTSRTCPCCKHISKSNRPTQAEFRCVECGFADHADKVAAENIRQVAVTQPYISDATTT